MQVGDEPNGKGREQIGCPLPDIPVRSRRRYAAWTAASLTDKRFMSSWDLRTSTA